MSAHDTDCHHLIITLSYSSVCPVSLSLFSWTQFFLRKLGGLFGCVFVRWLGPLGVSVLKIGFVTIGISLQKSLPSLLEQPCIWEWGFLFVCLFFTASFWTPDTFLQVWKSNQLSTLNKLKCLKIYLKPWNINNVGDNHGLKIDCLLSVQSKVTLGFIFMITLNWAEKKRLLFVILGECKGSLFARFQK